MIDDEAMTDTAAPAIAIDAPKRPRGSPVARAALLAYFLLIIYASWYPFSGWRGSGLSPLTFLSLAMPQYWTVFDVVVNVIGYIPFGMLLVMALHPAAIWSSSA